MTLARDTYVCHCDCHRGPEILPHRKPCCEEYARRLLEGDLDLTQREISFSEEHSSIADLVAERMLLVEAVRDWADARRVAREEYVKAVRAALEGGIKQAEIAIVAGVTPTAIRNLLKRT